MKVGPSMASLVSCVLPSIDGGSWSALRNLSGMYGPLWDTTGPSVVAMESIWGPLGSW